MQSRSVTVPEMEQIKFDFKVLLLFTFPTKHPLPEQMADVNYW